MKNRSFTTGDSYIRDLVDNTSVSNSHSSSLQQGNNHFIPSKKTSNLRIPYVVSFH